MCIDFRCISNGGIVCADHRNGAIGVFYSPALHLEFVGRMGDGFFFAFGARLALGFSLLNKTPDWGCGWRVEVYLFFTIFGSTTKIPIFGFGDASSSVVIGGSG